MRLLLPVVLFAAGGASATEPITGRWVTENGRAVVTVAPCGDALCGRISRILVPGQAPPDTRNPDPRLRGRPMLGLPVLTGFTDSGKDWRGRIYDPESGKSYKSIVSRDAKGLKVQGCIAMFCRTQRWTPAG
jgi:uncharacterized protein (DUF2147 family)